MLTREEKLEEIRETEKLLRMAREAILKLDPPDDELMRMLRVASECLEELRQSIPHSKGESALRQRRQDGNFMSH